MNREIKFRGWFQGINGIEKWVYGYLVKQKNGNWEITNGETYWTVDDVGQYTGLKDKNEVEIYEGDILEGHSDGNGVVTWSDYDGGYDYQFKDGEIVGISEVKRHSFVIGNIHQNPELL